MTKDTPPPTDAVAQLQLQIQSLEQIPAWSKTGFMNIADHMGDFSASFASGASRATSVSERIATKDSSLGLVSLRKDLKKTSQEIDGVFKVLDLLVKQREKFTDQLEKITQWGMSLEQDAFLPAMVDQVKGHGDGELLQQQTLGAIIDSLMRQISPLIQEIIEATRESANLICQLCRRLVNDLENSRHATEVIKKQVTNSMKNQAKAVHKIDGGCGRLEKQAEEVNGVVFEMVQAMQYDDITSQRIEHVNKTIEKIGEKLASQSQDEKECRWCAIATRISIDQLEEINTDLVTAVQTMHQHLIHISDLTEEQKGIVRAARDGSLFFRKETAEIVFQLNALLHMEVFDESLPSAVLRTLSQAENGLFQAKRALDMLTMTSGRLDQLINSMIPGANSRMDTLASSMADLVKRIQEEGKEVAVRLEQAARQLQELSLDFSEKTTPRNLRSNSLLRRIPLTTRQMDSNNEDILRMLNESQAETQATFTQIVMLTAELHFHHTIRRTIERVVRTLQEIVEALVGKSQAHSMDRDLRHAAEEFADLAELYTMASERQVHQAVVGDMNGQENGDDEEDDDNFELF